MITKKRYDDLKQFSRDVSDLIMEEEVPVTDARKWYRMTHNTLLAVDELLDKIDVIHEAGEER